MRVGNGLVRRPKLFECIGGGGLGAGAFRSGGEGDRYRKNQGSFGGELRVRWSGSSRRNGNMLIYWRFIRKTLNEKKD